MIEKRTLKQMGFVIGTGCDYEVWTYNSDFWVHFGGNIDTKYGDKISGNASMEDFFKLFIANIEKEVRESVEISFRAD